MLVHLAVPQDRAAFVACVAALTFAAGHGRTHRARIAPCVHLVLEHFVMDSGEDMGQDATILLLRTISDFDVTRRLHWAPFLLEQLRLGGDDLATVLQKRHRKHSRLFLMSCVWLADHLPGGIGDMVADIMTSIRLAADVWDELVLFFSGQGDTVTYPMGRSLAWSYHSPQVLGEDVTMSRLLFGDNRHEPMY